MNQSEDRPASSGPIRSKSRCAKRACDQCKFRKIKCSLAQPCTPCVSMGFDCTFLLPQKKRGPTGQRVSQIREQQVDHPSKTSCGSPASIANGVSYQVASSHPEPGPTEGMPMPETYWPTGGDASTPVHGQGFTSNEPMAVASGWSGDGQSIDWNTNSSISWNDVEHWLPADMDTQIPILDFPGNIYLKPSLPSMIQDTTGMDLHTASLQDVSLPNMDILQQGNDPPSAIWPASINEANMIPWIDVYFDRLHPTLPVLNRSSLFARMLAKEHRRNSQFGAMLLSLCAFALTQPIEINERPTSSSRASQARLMMHEATKMRSCAEFGEHPTIEAVLTSFFLFGCLFGSNQHNAAFLCLREALDLASTLRLNDPDLYYHLPSDETGQRLRTYLVLSITERAYALQRGHSITFWGKPGASMRPAYNFIHTATQSLVSGVIIHNERDAEGMLGLARLMELFDAIDEDVIDCWNRRCNMNRGCCEKLTRDKALSIHRNIAHTGQAEPYKNDGCVSSAIVLRETQRADLFITQKWLHNRIWVLCSTHGLLSIHSGSDEELRFSHAISVAESTLKICQSLRLSAMEAHGIGLVEKLFDIAISAIDVIYNAKPALKLTHASSMASTGDLLPGSSREVKLGSPAASPHTLAGKFLQLLSTLRGGNHPFLERYKAHLHSLQRLQVDLQAQ